MMDCGKLSLKWIFKFITQNILSVNDDIGLNLFKKRIVFWKSNMQRFKDKHIYSCRGKAQLIILQPRTLRYLQFIYSLFTVYSELWFNKH